MLMFIFRNGLAFVPNVLQNEGFNFHYTVVIKVKPSRKLWYINSVCP